MVPALSHIVVALLETCLAGPDLVPAMATKFKPKKKEAEAVVDDWEASGSDTEAGAEAGQSLIDKARDPVSQRSERPANNSRSSRHKADEYWDSAQDAQPARSGGHMVQEPGQPSGMALWNEA